MEKVISVYIEDEMKKAYLDYSMSVIVSRALPDVKDGLKPVHRRILYAMKNMGLVSNKPFRKCATVVGEVIGKYHPHGDIAVYDALVRMAQDFSMRYPLINGQGNFGSIDGDNAAAYRYTEARLSKIAELMLEDIDKETVPFVDNFDGRLKEPVFIPSRFPDFIANGTSGIAVGMATNIPPHNLSEVIDGLVSLIDNPEIEDLGAYIKGPDFPTGATIVGESGIKEAYRTGKGKIILKAVASIEEKEKRKSIIITEIPYQINKASLVERIAELIKEKKLVGIQDMRDESGKEGIRIVIELKKDANEEVILNNLYKHTLMKTTYGIILLGIHNGIPQLFTLKEALEAFLSHRYNVVKKRTQFDLHKAEQRAHILEGLKVALANIDKVVKIIRTSENEKMAKEKLISEFTLSAIQAQAILDMKLSRLVGLEREKLEKEYLELIKLMEKLKNILATKKGIMEVIKTELIDIKERFGDKRRTKIIEAEEQEFRIEDIIPDEDMAIILTEKGYVKRVPRSVHKTQARGGVGVIGIALREEDVTSDIFYASTHSSLLLFTDKGRCYSVKVYELPESDRAGKGRPLVGIIGINENEKIVNALPLKEFKGDIVFATKKGVVKRLKLVSLKNVRKNGIRAVSLRENDIIIGTTFVEKENDIILVSRKGKAIRFDEKDLRSMGRTATGVRGMRLNPDDEVIQIKSIPHINYEQDKKLSIFFCSKNGYGKKTRIPKFRKTRRGGKGIICMKREMAGCEIVKDSDHLIIISRKGKTLKTPVKPISLQNRSTKGVRVIRLKDDEVAEVRKL